MKPKRIILDGHSRREMVELVISDEGALYIAAVMEMQHRDAGALQIAERIRAALEVDIDETLQEFENNEHTH